MIKELLIMAAISTSPQVEECKLPWSEYSVEITSKFTTPVIHVITSKYHKQVVDNFNNTPPISWYAPDTVGIVSQKGREYSALFMLKNECIIMVQFMYNDDLLKILGKI